jgi:hypothetical protein
MTQDKVSRSDQSFNSIEFVYGDTGYRSYCTANGRNQGTGPWMLRQNLTQVSLQGRLKRACLLRRMQPDLEFRCAYVFQVLVSKHSYASTRRQTR